jgi:hypothetical protein
MQRNKITLAATAAALVAGGAVGAIIGVPGVSGAQDSGTTTTTVAAEQETTTTTEGSAETTEPDASTDSTDPARPDGDCDKTPLADDIAAKVEAAALEAVPGGEVLRTMAGRDGTGYAAHVEKEDGTHVVVLMDDAFAVTSVEDAPAGRGGPGGRHGGPHGAPLADDVAAKVEAAAVEAVPGGTVDHAEQDREGTGYHAHVTKADGTHVIVHEDEAFAVTSVEDAPAHR